MPAGADQATELRLFGEHALGLLARPGEPSAETVSACLRLFELAGEPVLARWMERELHGYGGSGAVALADALGIEEDMPLASRIRGYRQYVGRVRTAHATPSARAMQVPYFFGEGVETLRHCRANADAIGVDFIEVEQVTAAQAVDLTLLPPGAPARTLEFPRYTFYRILAGLAVELEIAVREVMKRGAPGAQASPR
jgi:hypothetical protein